MHIKEVAGVGREGVPQPFERQRRADTDTHDCATRPQCANSAHRILIGAHFHEFRFVTYCPCESLRNSRSVTESILANHDGMLEETKRVCPHLRDGGMC